MSERIERLEDLSPLKRELLIRKLQQTQKAKERLSSIVPRKDQSTFPLSLAQQQLWFLSQLNRNSPFYNIAAALRIQGPFDLQILREALRIVFDRHEILRMRIVTKSGEPEQVLAHSELPFQLVDLQDIPKQDRPAFLELLAKQEAQKSFDLAQDVLIRVKVLDCDPTDRVLLLTMHHIIADGWSMGILIKEMIELYQSLLSGQTLTLPELPLNYADFAEWQEHFMKSESYQQQVEYWKGHLTGAPSILELPTDKSRPAVQSYNGAHHRFDLPADLWEDLTRLGRTEQATPFMTFLAAFQAFMHRYSGQDDLCVGTPIANREKPEIQNLMGYFVNTLVMRADFNERPTFRELLRRIQKDTLDAFSNQDVPFEKLIEELNPERNPSHSPLVQVMFALQGSPLQGLNLPGVTISPFYLDNETAKFDLLLMLETDGQKLVADFEYNTDLFHRSSIVRMAQHFEKLLQSIVAAPDRKINELEMITATEISSIRSWNETQTSYPKDKTISELFEEQVKKTPDAVAVSYGDQQLTYRELNSHANRVANLLLSRGIRTEDLVAIYLPRSIDFIIATVGIIKSGAAYLPLDLDFPKDRIVFMLRDTQAPFLFTTGDLLEPLTEVKTEFVNFTRDAVMLAGCPDHNPKNNATPDHLAYVIYTSGSTGMPKGVSIPHKGVVRLVKETNYTLITPNDRIAQNSNAAFDAATYEIWGALLNGAELIGIPKDVALSPKEFSLLLREKNISALFVTTALFNLMAAQVPDAFRSLKYILFGGEAADPQSVRRILEAGPPVHLVHVYGPTENTTFSSYHPVHQVVSEAKSVPIGKSIANSQIYILDRDFRQVPVGIPGELCIAGDGLARDYLNRPDLTAEKFIPNPFAAIPGDRLYRTGDLVRYLDDGAIDFIGRLDFQVKIRGFRIEPDEVKAVLANQEFVKDAFVMVREDKPGEKRLVAYMIAQPDSNLSGSVLRSFLKERLPDYMIPSAFVFLPEFPLNANRKIDRKLLPAPEMDHSTDKVRIAPRTPLEQFLADHWKKVLGLESVGINDNFFEVGGDSLKAAVLINRLQEEVGEMTPVSAVFLAPTIAEFAMYVNAYYPDQVVKFFGTESSDQSKFKEKMISESSHGKIDAIKIAQMDQIIAPLPPRNNRHRATLKNPRAVFILSPPRSGSTLFRVMLAGHPQLFAPPELELLSFNTLQERKVELSDQFAVWLDATVRAIMEARNCDETQARALMEELENQDLTIKEFYGLLQQWIDGRLLVDKTPSYPLDLNILQRAEDDFDEPLYIHLTRHPYATIYSFIEARLDQNFFRYEHPFTRRELGELIWFRCHQNILQFLKEIPAQRQYRLSFESVLKNPAGAMQSLCDFLGLEYHPKMIEPYDGNRMTDGVKPHAQMVGDFKFYLRKSIDTRSTDRWKTFHTEDFLSDTSWQVAQQLGYFPEAPPGISHESATSTTKMTRIERIPRGGELPLSFAQLRLWFLDQMIPNSPLYNVPAAIRLIGNLNVTAIKKSLLEIVRRHEVLRTTYPTTDGKASLRIAAEPQMDFSYLALDHLDKSAAEEEATRKINDDANQPFDLVNGPLVRVYLYRIQKDEHILLLVMHHIVSDGWSIGILVSEMGLLYESFSKNETPRLPELPVQYLDYAAWQTQWLKDEVMKRQLDFWRQTLANSPLFLQLPTDRPRPALMSNQGSRLPFFIPAPEFQKIRELAHHRQITPFMVLLATLNVLLARYSVQTDINVGSPVANRTRSEIEPLIGFFVNSVVLRTDLSGEMTFVELLQKVKQVCQDAFAHQDIPFEKVVDAIHPERDMSHSPLFQVMFAYQKASVQNMVIPGLEIRPMDVVSGTSKFDLTLEIMEKTDELRGTMEYNTDLFDRSTIQRMVRHFRHLLQNFLNDPEQNVHLVELYEAEERQQLIENWNRTTTSLPVEAVIHTLFEAQVARTPEVLAVVYEDAQLSYRELNERANRLAHHLRARGVTPDSLVGLCLERSTALVVGILGVLKAGAAYVPLDPYYPAARLEYIIEDAGLQHIITQALLAESLPFAAEQLVLIDADWDEISLQSTENPSYKIGGGNLAYVIYTSGSTGQPKGVMIEQRSAVNLWQSLHELIYSKSERAQLRIGWNAPILFDASVQQWLMLLSGQTLDIIPQELRGDGEGLVRFIRDRKLDALDCVPSQLKLMLEAGLLDEGQWIPSIMLPGGEAIDQKMWQVISNSAHCDFYNMYGPTECTVDSTICRTRGVDRGPSIGKPVGNTQHYILDKYLRPVPIGVSGELYISGYGLARAYLNRPELTAERFMPNPFSRIPGERMYRTGDRARYWPDGHIEYLGRLDDQVKIRGFRIELGEIETVLEQHPAVKQAVVVAHEEGSGIRRLVCYYQLAQVGDVGVSELREFIKTRLPDYMVPAIFMMLEKFPLTPNGKVDRKALPEPMVDRAELEGALILPRNPKEEALAEIWKQVLGLKQVGVTDNFFELGGDSILSIQVISRASRAGLRLTPRQLFQYPTIEKLASVAVSAPAIQAEQGLVTGEVPFTPIQHRFLEQRFAQPNHWNQSVLLQLERPLESALLQKTLERLIQHHDALRLRIEQRQYVIESIDQDILEIIDLTNVPDVQLKVAIESCAAKTQAQLDLNKGQLIRAAYFDTGKARPHRLLIVIHHWAIDGVSWRILLEDLRLAYGNAELGQEITLAPKTTSFKHWANKLEQFATSSTVREQMTFWSTQKPVQLGIPTKQSGQNTEQSQRLVSMWLEETETSALLQKVPAVYNTQIQDILLTALVRTMSRWNGNRELWLNLEGHGREDLFEDVDLSRTVGWFTTLYPIHLDLNKAVSIADEIKLAKEQLRRVPMNGIGYGMLRYLNHDPEIQNALKSMPDPQVVFNYLGQFSMDQQASHGFKIAEESPGPERGEMNHRDQVFSISGRILDGRFGLDWAYSSELHDESTMTQLINWYFQELSTLIQHCLSVDETDYTPSDFKDVKLSDLEIENMMSELTEEVEDE